MFYVKEHTKTPLNELMEVLGNVNQTEVETLISHYKNQHIDDSKKVNDPDAHIAGNLMQRQPGVVVMTKEASELGDARKALAVKPDPNFASRKANMIHTIRK